MNWYYFYYLKFIKSNKKFPLSIFTVENFYLYFIILANKIDRSFIINKVKAENHNIKIAFTKFMKLFYSLRLKLKKNEVNFENYKLLERQNEINWSVLLFSNELIFSIKLQNILVGVLYLSMLMNISLFCILIHLKIIIYCTFSFPFHKYPNSTYFWLQPRKLLSY